MNDKVLFDISLASLLHDIGKFAYRCVPEEMLFGTRSGQRKSHEDFNKDIIYGLFASTDFKKYWEKSAHIENTCVLLGDWISAQERDDLDVSDERNKPRTTPLKTIFSSVDGTNKDIFWIHRNLCLDLPKKEDYTNEKHIIFSEDCYREFLEELEKLDKKYDLDNQDNRHAFFRELLDLMKKHLSYIPSAVYYSEPNIDIYNHSKLACAISACLYQYYIDLKLSDGIKKNIIGLKSTMSHFFNKKRDTKTEEEKAALTEEMKKDLTYKEKYFLLCKGNFSGIQDFVSTISSTKASALLKARSFYLSYLNRLLPLYIVRQLDLPETNIIFSSGGNFEILLPNTEKTKDKIKTIANDTNNYLLKNSGITLFLEISLKEMSALDFHRDVFPEFISKRDWTEVTSKNKKFAGNLKDIDLFEPKLLKHCCGICFKDTDELYDVGKDDDKVKACAVCKSLYELRKTINDWQIKGKTSGLSNLFCINGYDAASLLKYGNEYANINKTEGIYEMLPLGFPLNDDGSIIDFDNLAKSAEQRTGERKIGALKFDVDNLGRIFGGSAKDKLSFSIYSRLSFDIALFFDGIINTLQSQEKYSRDIYIIYSGGDDGFIVGAWDKVLDFAKDLMSYFRIYVNMHPKITISVAYNLFSPKFPVKKIFEALEEDLAKAKNMEGKSAIVLFRTPVKWEYFDGFRNHQIADADENLAVGLFDNIHEIIKSYPKEKEISFEIVFKLASLLSDLVKTHRIPRSFLMRFISLSLDMTEGVKRAVGGDALDISPAWRMEYYLKRADAKDKDLLEKLIKLWKELYSVQLKDYPQKELMKENNIMQLVAIASKIAQLDSGENKGGRNE